MGAGNAGTEVAVTEAMQNRDRVLLLVVGGLAGAITAWFATSRAPTAGPSAEEARAAAPEGADAEDEGRDGRTRDDEPRTVRTRSHSVGELGRDGMTDAELTTADGKQLSVHIVGEKRLTRIADLSDASEMWLSEHGSAASVREPAWGLEGLQIAYRVVGEEPGLVRWTPEGFERLAGTKLASAPVWTPKGLVFELGQRIQLLGSDGPELLTAPIEAPSEQSEPAVLGRTLWFVQDAAVLELDLETGASKEVATGRSPAPGPELAWVDAAGDIQSESGARSGDPLVERGPVWLDAGELSWQRVAADGRVDVVVESHLVLEDVAANSLHSQAASWLVVPSKAQDSLLFTHADELVELRLSSGAHATDPALRARDGRLHVAFGDRNKLVVLDITELLLGP